MPAKSKPIAPEWAHLKNLRMAEALTAGACLDVSKCKRTPDGDYILDAFVDGKDYCDAFLEAWIISIGRDRYYRIFASTSSKFYGDGHYTCLFLR